jgi:hypothetical protein
LLRWGTTFGDGRYWRFPVRHVFSDVKHAVAVAILLDVGVSIVTWADDVAIHLEDSRGKATRTGRIAIPFFIALQSFQKVLKRRGVRM